MFDNYEMRFLQKFKRIISRISIASKNFCYRAINCFETNKIGTMLIDFVFIGLFISCLTCEYYGKLSCFDFLNIKIDSSVSFIAAVIPMVTFIVTISLDHNDKHSVFGLTRNDFSKLRGGFNYGLLHMVIISIFAFVAYFIAFSLNLKYTIFVVDIISVFYSLWFAIQEFSIHAGIKFVMRHILCRHYKRSLKQSGYLQSPKYKIFHSAKVYSLFTYGILTTFRYLKNKKITNDEIINDLLDTQNKYLYKTIENLNAIKEGFLINDLIPISNIAHAALNNIDEILNANQEISFLNLGPNYVYQLTRSTFSIRTINQHLKNSENEFYNLFFKIKNLALLENASAYKTAAAYMAVMFVYTLKSEDKYWFINKALEIDYGIYIDIDNNYSCILAFGFLISLFYCSLSADNKETIFKVWDKWINGFRLMFEDGDKKLLSAFLSKMLEIYNSANDGYYYLSENNDYIEESTKFTFNFIIDCWITLFVYGGYYEYSEKDFTIVLNNLDSKIKEKLAFRLNYYWFDEDKHFLDCDSAFSALFVGTKKEILRNNNAIKALVAFIDVEHKNEADKILKKSDPDIIKKYKQIIADNVTRTFSSLDFIDSTISMDNSEIKYFNFMISGMHRDELIDAYMSIFSRSVNYFFREYIYSNAEIINCKDYYDVAEKAIALSTTIMSNKGFLFHIHENKQLVEAINEMEIVDSEMLPNYSFLRDKNSIKVNIKYHEEKSRIGFLTDSEVEDYIDKNYTELNGMYRFSLDGDKRQSFLVNRVELARFIKNNFVYVGIVFEYKVILDGAYIIKIKDDKQN